MELTLVTRAPFFLTKSELLALPFAFSTMEMAWHG